MNRIFVAIIIVVLISFPAYAGDHIGDFLNEQVPQNYEYPLWMKIFGEYFLRILIGGMIFFSISGIPEERLLSARGFAGILVTMVFFIITILYNDLYTQVLEVGFKSFALFIGGLLLIGIIFQALRSGLQKLLSK